MPPKQLRKRLTQGRRRCRTILPPRSADYATRTRQAHQAGADLMKRLLVMFSVCKLSPADLCICCYHLALMDAPGADWRLYAYPPDRHASIYQTHLDTVLPPVGPFYHVDTPIWSKGGGRGLRNRSRQRVCGNDSGGNLKPTQTWPRRWSVVAMRRLT